MEVSTSDEEVDFIRRAPVMICVGSDSEETRPVTPPMDQSVKLNKSLGLVLSPQSPPYRRIRSMKLIESPRSFLKTRLDQPFTSTPTPSPCVQNVMKRVPRTSSRIENRSRLLGSADVKEKMSVSNGTIPAAYVNPFTPGSRPRNSKVKNNMKRTSQKSFTFDSDENDSDGNEGQSQVDIKKPKLSDFNTPRYQEEFLELEVIGTGMYGCVFRCLNRLNGVEYAVKRGLKPINNERIAHNEIYAHGVLDHPNIVRNYSSWTENDYVYMQNEYCNGGSLEDAIKAGSMEEKTVRKVLEQVAQGLRFIHSKNLAHMDIKPGNILIHRGARVFYKHNYDCADEFCEDEDSNEETIYKIADLGHVTRLDEVVDVREGDCRYLPREILNDDYSNLTKVDIFALGLTLYEAAGGGPLPKNGDEWHNIRDGKLKSFPHLSNDLNSQLKRMVHPNPDMRPSASDLLSTTSWSPIYKTVKDKHELKAAKQRIQVLEQQLEDVVKCMKVLRQTTENKRQIGGSIYKNNNTTYINNNKGERLVGKKSKRSQSTTMF